MFLAISPKGTEELSLIVQEESSSSEDTANTLVGMVVIKHSCCIS